MHIYTLVNWSNFKAWSTFITKLWMCSHYFLDHPRNFLHVETSFVSRLSIPVELSSVRACVKIFKHEYLRDQQADRNQILPEAALGWGKGFLSFFSFDTALPPREDYVQVDSVLKPRYKKCTEKRKDEDNSVTKNVQEELIGG